MKKVMSLGDFIDALAAIKDERLPLVCEDGRFLGTFGSYRGYYSDLALQPVKEAVSCGLVLTRAVECDGKTFQGYKGGDYKMDRYTRLWVSDYGDNEGIRPVLLVPCQEIVRVEVVNVED